MTTEQHVYTEDGVRLYVKTWGDVAHTPIVLVHGYPDNHTVWAPIAEQLATDSYVIAYDVRGAGKSDVPPRIRDYRLEVLAQDLKAVTEQVLGERGFHLAAHDWGSIQSWESVTTAALQGKILSYTSLSGPALDHAGFWLRSKARTAPQKALKQLAKSWYIYLFHLPVLAPTAWQLGLGDKWGQVVEKMEQKSPLPENPTQTADGKQGVQLYRANFIDRIFKPRIRRAHCPVQVVVLKRDAFVDAGLFDELSRWVSQLSFQELDAAHWAILSRPTEIAQLIKQYVRQIEVQRKTAA
ncbi:MAG: alpha/beta fold hydrolase [Pseudomonadota bacterium]|nr:alpha/beta fold hydrolase [Pseudomonadota bacterium]